MRVLMVSKALVVGAYQRKLEELAQLPGVELTVVVPPAWGDRRGKITLQRAYTAGYNLVVAPIMLGGRYHLHFYPTLGRILARLRPDVLHMDEEPYNLATWHALRLGRALGARSLFFTWQNLDRRYPWPFSFFERQNYRLAQHALAGNRTAADVLRAKGFKGPITVVPQFGVDPYVFAPLPPEAARPAGRGPFRIGYAGGLVAEKGVDLLLHACAALPCPQWSLAVVGEGAEKAALKALADKLGIAGQVCWLGHRASTEMPDFYRELDVLVLPSRSQPNWKEQFGRVLIEAMSCEVAVVGAESGEIPHVIGDAGLLFPEGDAVALRDVLAALAADLDLRARLAVRGRARVLRRFTQAQIASMTYEVYREMLASPAVL